MPGIGNGQVYGYRAFGPNYPEAGLRFDPEKLLLDPYGRGVAVPAQYSREAAKERATTRPTPCAAWSSMGPAMTGKAMSRCAAPLRAP